MRKVIVNTTPLIALCHVGQLELLKKIYGEIMIPRAVYRELSEKKESICKKRVDNSYVVLATYFSSKLPSATAFTDEAYSDGVMPVIFLNWREK